MFGSSWLVVIAIVITVGYRSFDSAFSDIFYCLSGQFRMENYLTNTVEPDLIGTEIVVFRSKSSENKNYSNLTIATL